MENLTLHWKGKKVCFLGDSMTEGVGVSKDTVYWSLLGEKIGIKTYGYGLNGSKYIELLDQAKTMFKDHGNDVDAIFLFAGTNDFYGNTLIGDWYIESEKNVDKTLNKSLPNEKETRKFREFDFNTNTFKGSINSVLSYLKTHYPNKQIIVMTPIHRAYATFGPDNVQYDEGYANSIGVFFDKYVETVKEAASIWATELIDLHSVSGLFPVFDFSAELYFCNIDTDRLHPNTLGHQRLAEVISKKMIGIPVF